jgi:DNA-binding response OmpR family regulator
MKSDMSKKKGRLAGAHIYLTKPFRQQDVVAVAQQYLGAPREDSRLWRRH